MRRPGLTVIALFFSVCAAHAQVPETDRDALIALYNATNGPGWIDNTGWLGAVGTECTWAGVFCNNGHVDVLYLDSNQLSGSIPPEIGDFSGLRDLSLQYNQLSGSLPPELANLSDLLIFSAIDNQLSGEIPPEMGSFPHLYRLWLSRNEFSGSIPPELGNLPDMASLWLDGNQLSGGFPPEFGNLIALRSLRLSYNLLTGTLPPQIGDLESLQDMTIYGNHFSGSLPPELGNLQYLYFLGIASNHFSGPIPAEFGAMSRLRNLYLNSNMLSGNLPAELEDITTLVQVDFWYNALHSDDPDLIALIDSLQAGGDWQSSQTIAPENVAVAWVGDTTVWLSWDGVSFTPPGGYEVFAAPSTTGSWISVGKTGGKTEIEIPATGLEPGTPYDFGVATFTMPTYYTSNDNVVTSDLSPVVTAVTSAAGCPQPVIEISWGYPTVLTLSEAFDSYAWNTAQTTPSIAVDPTDPRFYWVTVTGPASCRESATVLVDPSIFADGFESGNAMGWGQ
jgi:Leucine Rich Repeat